MKRRLLAEFGYGDSRVKKLDSMRDWGLSSGHYHSSCQVAVHFPNAGGLVVSVTGDAPVDQTVRELAAAEGGSFEEYNRGSGLPHGRTLRINCPPANLDVMLRLADALDGLPGRHDFDRNHYFYEAPKAAGFLRQIYAVLVRV